MGWINMPCLRFKELQPVAFRDACLAPACPRSHLRSQLFRQSLQPAASFIQLGFRLGKTESNQLLATAAMIKSAACHRGNSCFTQQGHRLFFARLAGKNTRIRQNVIRTIGDRRGEADFFQHVAQLVTLLHVLS